MASLKEIRRLRNLCNQYELENREVLNNYTDKELKTMYNGIGPASFPDWLRDGLDYLHPSLEPVALIHDVEWELSDGTKESFTASNERFKRNGKKVAKAAYAWWNIRRYLVISDANLFGNLCQKFGFAAWQAGAGNV